MSRLTPLLVLLGSVSCWSSANAQVDESRGACGASEWVHLPPVDLPDISRLNQSSYAPYQGSWVVAGLEASLLDTLTPPGPLRVFTASGDDLGRPPGDFTFVAPRIMSDESTLHLVWTEPRPASPSTPEMIVPPEMLGLVPVSSVWYARYGSGRWSAPRLVYAAADDRELTWNTRNASTVLDSAGGLHVITHDVWKPHQATFVTETPVTRLVHVRIGAQRDAVHTVPIRDPAIGFWWYDFDAVGRDFFIVYNARGRLFFLRSRDAGETWSDPTELRDIPNPHGNTVQEAEIVATSDGQVHVVWDHDVLDDQTLGHVVSYDRGRTWTSARYVPIQASVGNMADLSATADRCGGFHISFSAGPRMGPNVQTGYVAWDGEQWDTPFLIFAEVFGFQTEIVRDSSGELRYVALTREGREQEFRTLRFARFGGKENQSRFSWPNL